MSELIVQNSINAFAMCLQGIVSASKTEEVLPRIENEEISFNISGAATQYAETTLNLVDQASTKYREKYWLQKLKLISEIYGVTLEFGADLMSGSSYPSFKKLLGSEDQRNTSKSPTDHCSMMTRMAFVVAANYPKPLEGILAVRGTSAEKVVWSKTTRELSDSIEAYKLASQRKLSGLLTATVPMLGGLEIPINVLIDKGLPYNEPGPAWEDW